MLKHFDKAKMAQSSPNKAIHTILKYTYCILLPIQILSAWNIPHSFFFIILFVSLLNSIWAARDKQTLPDILAIVHP